MYSGTTFTRYSGRMLGAHQKIDRIARRHLKRLLPDDSLFPPIRQILHFEGKNGPDAIKRKSPAKDEPWHYYSPNNSKDAQLIDLLNHHHKQLVKELAASNQEKAAFEAAWLAHAIVDGLTPAHHYPYEEKLTELSGGQSIGHRTSIRKKLFLPGGTRKEKLKNNWKMWGPKGLFSTHALFELGIATVIKPLSFSEAQPTQEEIDRALKTSINQLFVAGAQKIASMGMYERYYISGWTPGLAYEVKHNLGPVIIKTVTLAWYRAAHEAKLLEHQPTL